MAIKCAFVNQKGGVGKTTSCICIAYTIQALLKKRVLVIDTDGQCDTTNFFGAKTEDQETMLDVFCGDNVDVHHAVQHCTYGDVIASEPDVYNVPERLAEAGKDSVLILKERLAVLEDEYDFIFVDCPPGNPKILMNVFAYVDTAIVVVQESGFDLRGFMNMVQMTYLPIKENVNPNLSIAGILNCMTQPQTNKSKRMLQSLNEIAAKLGTSMFETSIRKSVKVEEALCELNVPLLEYDLTNTAQLDYEDVINELMERLGLPDRANPYRN